MPFNGLMAPYVIHSNKNTESINYGRINWRYMI